MNKSLFLSPCISSLFSPCNKLIKISRKYSTVYFFKNMRPFPTSLSPNMMSDDLTEERQSSMRSLYWTFFRWLRRSLRDKDHADVHIFRRHIYVAADKLLKNTV